MKKFLILLIFLLTLPVVATVPPAECSTHDWCITTADFESEIIDTDESYCGVDYLDELDEYEGGYPLYVLVVGDEEERDCWRRLPPWRQEEWHDWTEYATWQIERADERLVEEFSIDIRILGFIEWDSWDFYTYMVDLAEEFWKENKQLLGTEPDGIHSVDCIIGITHQETHEPRQKTYGLTASPKRLDAGEIVMLLKWKAYWADNNLVRHEVSHIFYAPDHHKIPSLWGTCCVMADNHTHYRLIMYEDGGIFWVEDWVLCAYLEDDWCDYCHEVIMNHQREYYEGGGCPILSVYDGIEYVTEGLMDIHNPDGIDEVATRSLTVTSAITEHRYLLQLTEHNQTHSHIDQVQLYATLTDGTAIKLPLVSAVHSNDGNVLQELLFSDDVRADTLGADHNNGTSEYINLQFIAPEGLEIVEFRFWIEGHNIISKK